MTHRLIPLSPAQCLRLPTMLPLDAAALIMKSKRGPTVRPGRSPRAALATTLQLPWPTPACHSPDECCTDTEKGRRVQARVYVAFLSSSWSSSSSIWSILQWHLFVFPLFPRNRFLPFRFLLVLKHQILPTAHFTHPPRHHHHRSPPLPPPPPRSHPPPPLPPPPPPPPPHLRSNPPPH